MFDMGFVLPHFLNNLAPQDFNSLSTRDENS